MRKLPSCIPRHKAAEELGGSLTTLKRWENLTGFPKPKTKLFGKDYFYFPDIVAWMENFDGEDNNDQSS